MKEFQSNSCAAKMFSTTLQITFVLLSVINQNTLFSFSHTLCPLIQLRQWIDRLQITISRRMSSISIELLANCRIIGLHSSVVLQPPDLVISLNFTRDWHNTTPIKLRILCIMVCYFDITKCNSGALTSLWH